MPVHKWKNMAVRQVIRLSVSWWVLLIACYALLNLTVWSCRSMLLAYVTDFPPSRTSSTIILNLKLQLKLSKITMGVHSYFVSDFTRNQRRRHIRGIITINISGTVLLPKSAWMKPQRKQLFAMWKMASILLNHMNQLSSYLNVLVVVSHSHCCCSTRSNMQIFFRI